MFGLSCCDLVASHGYFLGTWLVPAGTIGKYGPVALASGTETTCNYSGFVTQFAVSSPLYNASLSLYYLLSIRYQWTEQRLCQVEMFLHGVPICFALGTALAGVILDLYGNVEWLCWISPDPSIDDRLTKAFQWLFLFVPVWVCSLFVSVVMLFLWLQMRKLERAVRRYSVHAADGSGNEKSRQMAIQGWLYAAAFWVTWLFPSMQRVTELTKDENYFILQVLDTTLLPLQGAFNALIFIRPRLRAYRQRHAEMAWCEFLLHAVAEQLMGRSFRQPQQQLPSPARGTPVSTITDVESTDEPEQGPPPCDEISV